MAAAAASSSTTTTFSIPQDILDKFSLVLGEKQPLPIPIPQSFLLKKEDLAYYLVFKIFTRKQLQVESLTENLATEWNCRSPPRISRYHGDEIFLAKFDNKSDVDRIVEGAPWLFDSDLISVQRCKPNTLPSAYPFHISPFWVQLHGLPVDFLTADVAVLLGNQLGSAVSPSREEVEKWINFIRIRVDIDVCKPLVGSIPLALPSNETITAQIRYEDLPEYCCFCGMIGHDSDQADWCPALMDLEAAIPEELPDESKAFLRWQLSQPKYKDSLRALPSCFLQSDPIPAEKMITTEIAETREEKMSTTEIAETREDTKRSVCKNNSQCMQLSGPANDAATAKFGKGSDKTSLVLELHGAQIISLFKKMFSCIRPSIDNITQDQLGAIIPRDFTGQKLKVVIKVQMLDAKARSRALKQVISVEGTVSVQAFRAEDKLEVISVGLDPVALAVRLRKLMGFVDLVSVSLIEYENREPQLFVDIRHYAMMRGQPAAR